MSNLRFAIVIPSYNQGHFIGQTVDSILAQTGEKVDIWVQDGGSSDETLDVLAKYGKKIHVVSQKDRGQSDAINRGFDKIIKVYSATADEVIVAYLNSDDFYIPGAFRTVRNALSEHPERQWVVGDCLIVNEVGQPWQRAIQWYKKLWRVVLSWPVLLTLNPIPQPAVFLRLSAIQKVGSFNEQLHYTMDYEYWLRCWQSIGAPSQVSKPLAAFRIHGQSKGSTGFVSQFAEQLQVAKTLGAHPAWLFCQNVHNRLITGIYSFIK